MRKINKQAPVASFQTFTTTNPGADWPRDFSRRDAIGYESYLESRMTILVGEQDCQCGYTEILINDEKDCHIDHYCKRDLFPQLTFDWNNLIASCNDEDFGAKYKDNKAQVSHGDYFTFFNPVIDQVHQFLYYNQRGEIEPHPSLSDDSLIRKVKRTIEVFNLQNSSLVNRRRTIIEMIRSLEDLNNEEKLEAMNQTGFKSVVLQEIESGE